jgi:hypothetical protein
MADLARIKRNVAKMAAQNAPVSDIDGYIASEGVTVDDVRNFRPGVQTLTGGATPGAGQASFDAGLAALQNPMRSALPGQAGDVQDTSRAAQSGMMQGMTLGFGDELMAGLMTPIEAGIDLAQGKGLDIGRSYNQALQKNRGTDAQSAALNPGANLTGEIGGAFLNPLARLSMAGKAKGVGVPLIAGAEGAAQGAAYGFGKGETMDERLQGAATGAMWGAPIGAVAPAIGSAVAKKFAGGQQRTLTNKAIKGAPNAADFKAEASAAFQAADSSGVTIDTPKFGQFVNRLVQNAKMKRINPDLDTNSVAAFKSLIQALDDVQKNGGALTISDMHTLRQIAQDAAQKAGKGRDYTFANDIVKGIDDFITQPGVAQLPKNRIGNSAPANQAANDLLKAISMWSRSKKVAKIELAIQNAELAASGLENGLRNEFRKLLKSERHLFTKAEQQAMEDVVKGNSVSNLTKLIGKFGFGTGPAGNMLGGLGGFAAGSAFLPGGPIAALAGTAAATGARKLSEVLTNRAAQRAAKVVATPNVPAFQPQALPPSLTGGMIGASENIRRKKRPVDITIYGGA